MNALQRFLRLFRTEPGRIGDHHLGQPKYGVERSAQLVAHIGEELRLVLASRFNLLIETPQFLAHPIDVGRQRTQLVAIDDMDALGEIAGRNLVEPGFNFLDGTDQRPRDRIAEDQGEHDASQREGNDDVP